MAEELLNFKSNSLFPSHLRLLGIVFLFLGLVLLVYSPYFAPILLLAGLLILTGHQGILFAPSKHSFKEYNSFLFVKFGNWGKYDNVECILINSSKTSQKVYTRLTEGVTIRNIEYDAYLQLSDKTKLYLMTKKDKNTLINKLTRLADFFHVEITDNTEQKSN